jgi:hypothetical protein
MTIDLNDAGTQQSRDVIPDNTLVNVVMTVKPGGAGDDGMLTAAKDGNSEHLNCEFTVLDGEHAKRKIFTRLTVTGKNHAQAIGISRKTLKAILECARGIKPSDESDAAKAARQVKTWADFDQLRVIARLGVEPPRNGFQAKNFIKEIITPDHASHKKLDQVDRSTVAAPAAAAALETATAAAPANAISRPDWAK